VTTKRITTALLRRWPLPKLDPEGGKVSRGKLLVAGGSDTVAGAVTLAGLGGLRAGAGTLQIATTRGAMPIVAGAVPEARVLALPTKKGQLAPAAATAIARLAAQCDAIVLGPGAEVPHIARGARGDATWIIDAAAIEGFRKLAKRPRHAVLTPHPGEMASLCQLDTDEVMARPAELACEMAKKLRCVVALKCAVTFIAAPDGRVFESTAGNHGLGTSGSGDVLAGVIGGLAARGADPLQAAVWGVHLHGHAGDVLARRLGPLGVLARELLDEIPPAIAHIERGRRK
jgi:hydroxyethylthiazole kinase-like uncharacterized protein yjeF